METDRAVSVSDTLHTALQITGGVGRPPRPVRKKGSGAFTSPHEKQSGTGAEKQDAGGQLKSSRICVKIGRMNA